MRIHRTRVLKLLIIVNPKLFRFVITDFFLIFAADIKRYTPNVGIFNFIKMKIRSLKFKNEKQMENVILAFVKCDIRFATVGRLEIIILTD